MKEIKLVFNLKDANGEVQEEKTMYEVSEGDRLIFKYDTTIKPEEAHFIFKKLSSSLEKMHNCNRNSKGY
nr:hypothetical protein [Bacillus velezensis]